jgi:hypothetical protein
MDKASLVEKFNRRLIAAVFPHERKKPDSTLANGEVGRGVSHLGVYRWYGLLRVIFGLPALKFTLPILIGSMQYSSKCPYLPQFWDEYGKTMHP